jgi:hypothetical protein
LDKRENDEPVRINRNLPFVPRLQIEKIPTPFEKVEIKETNNPPKLDHLKPLEPDLDRSPI